MNGFTFSLDDMANSWITKTLTALIRKDVINKSIFQFINTSGTSI